MSEKNDKKQEILDAFYFRHATKEFDISKKINEEDFEFILETARLSPSSIGYEPWRFIIIQNPELREKLKDVASGAARQLDTASHFVLILAHTEARYDSEYATYINKHIKGLPEETIEELAPRYKAFQQDNQNLFESERSLFDWASKQTYIALGNMMSTAAQIGIDSCPIEGFHAEKVNELLKNEDIIAEGSWKVSVMVAFGYRTAEPAREKTRQRLSDIVHWEN
ncbi:NAD(P)H-dependent oxidoreductase [Alkalicoccobacillus porphyridii]|uniref:NAD(P)H-dependent oxidoreductase n=1 Tax=Alkalicoccobacillus porphyridii TaxID=2597270 RepID=A0A553ZXD1_9BACI|nr:NAD(P)H-dependent oxidoreductase [Alkalicoccobacillus porphyridii]TSB46006.1 NAD(P)H-dependent oxidoreductase [Alkalicoccobacillus porphyridii]